MKSSNDFMGIFAGFGVTGLHVAEENCIFEDIVGMQADVSIVGFSGRAALR
jgi:hypothetical protein